MKNKSVNLTKSISVLLLGCAALSGCGSDNYGNDTPPANPGAGNDAPVTAAGPSRSSTIALTSDDQRLVVVNRQSDSVSVIQVKDDQGNDVETKVAELTVGKDPRYVAISPDNTRAFVTNAVDATVSVINIQGTTPALESPSIPVGSEPRGIAITPNGKYVYVANHTQGTVSVISTATMQVVSTVNVGGNPMAISITNDNDTDDRDENVMVTRFFSEVIDPVNRPDGFNDSKQGKVDYFSVAASLEEYPEVAQYQIAPIEDSGFVADRRRFCLSTRQVLQDNKDVIFFNSGVELDKDGAASLASNVFCPDGSSDNASDNGPIANTIQGAYPNQLFSSVIRNNTLYIPSIGASPEPPVFFAANVQALVTSFDMSAGTQITTNLNNQIKRETNPDEFEVSLDRLFGNDVVAIDANQQGSDFLVVSRGGNYVLRASLGSDGALDIGAPDNVIRFQTGNIPNGVVMNSSGDRAYTNNEVSTSVTSIDLSANTVLTQDISSSTPPAPGTQKHRNVVGKLAFYTALGIPDTLDTNGDSHFDIDIRAINPIDFRGKASDSAWSSCASCHEDGHSDNVTWIFPTGPRQTIPLEGTFANSDASDQRILNWNGVRGSVTDFNNNSRGVQNGTGFAEKVIVNGIETNRREEIFNHGPTEGISDALDAMTEWVANAVRAPISPKLSDDIALANGREIFTQSCASCHGGEKWTKSTITAYLNNPTFNANPLGANFFAEKKEIPLDDNLIVAGPQIVGLKSEDNPIRFLDKVGTFNKDLPLEIRGAGALGGGVISNEGDKNEGLFVDKQSTQGFASLGGAGFNTPSLLGVAYHSPYLHDGSAITLDDVFALHTLPDDSDEVDKTIEASIVNENDLQDLRQFLLSIDDSTEIIQ